MTKNHYREIQGALLRQCRVFADRLTPLVGQTVPLNLDAFTDEGSWPDSHFVGLGEFNLVLDDFYEGTCVIALGLTEDSNLLQSSEMVAMMLDDLLPNSSLPVYNMTTAEEIGLLLIMKGVQVGAPLPTKTRPLIPIMLGFSSNLSTG